MCRYSLAARSQSAKLWAFGKACSQRDICDGGSLSPWPAARRAWPGAARAQQAGQAADNRLHGGSDTFGRKQVGRRICKTVGGLGWVEGRTVTIEYRWAEGRAERYAEIAAEFVARKVDVIVTWGSAPVVAAKQATVAIPIVFAAQMDPLSVGVIASLARPGGNVTGLSLQQTDTAGKRLEILREVVPNLRRLAIIANVGAPGAVLEMGEVAATARALGLEVTTLEIRRAEDVAPGIGALKTARTHFTSRLTRFYSPIVFKPMPWRRTQTPNDLREPGICRGGRFDSYGPTGRTYFDGLLTM